MAGVPDADAISHVEQRDRTAVKENVVAERVILVDQNDHEIGLCDKLSAHAAAAIDGNGRVPFDG